MARTTAIFSSSNRSIELTFTTSFTTHHLLSVETGESLQKPSPVSIRARANMPPQKKMPPFYMEARDA
jgi:hypothetical protein